MTARERPGRTGLVAVSPDEIRGSVGQAVPAIPLTPPQQRLWFLQNLRPTDVSYNILTAVEMFGPADPASLAAATNAITQRHGVLRATFGLAGTRPVQRIGPALTSRPRLVDLTGLPSEQREPELTRCLTRAARRPFNLAQGPVAEWTLMRLDTAHHVLVFSVHHIAFDGGSLGIACRELEERYAASRAGEPAPLRPTPGYAVAHRPSGPATKSTRAAPADLAYWRRHLAGAPARVRAFRGNSVGPVGSGVECVTFALGGARITSLNSVGRRYRCTPFMVLLSVFAGLLGRYTGLTDIVVGTPVSTRISDEDLAAIGPFLNMLPVRLDLGGDPSLADILARTREEVLSAFEHRGVPFERLVQELGPARHLDHTPLFQNVFAFQESPSAPQLRDLHTRLRPVEPAAPKYELTVIATGVAGEIEITVQGDRMACDAATLQLFAANLDTVLAGALHDPARPFVRLPVLGVIEAPEADGPPILSPPAAWSGPIIAPRTALEEAIATAWCAVLGVAEVDVRRNFFEVGGDSLLLLDLHATVRATVAAEVTLADLFRFPSVETLAQALTNDGDDQTAATAAARGARRRAHLVRHAGSPGRS